jgi:hypothetical protein
VGFVSQKSSSNKHRSKTKRKYRNKLSNKKTPMQKWSSKQQTDTAWINTNQYSKRSHLFAWPTHQQLALAITITKQTQSNSNSNSNQKTQHNTTQHNTPQHNTPQQHNAVQHKTETAYHNTIKHKHSSNTTKTSEAVNTKVSGSGAQHKEQLQLALHSSGTLNLPELRAVDWQNRFFFCCFVVVVVVVVVFSRQGKARQGKARKGNARQGKARQGNSLSL